MKKKNTGHDKLCLKSTLFVSFGGAKIRKGFDMKDLLMN